MTNLTRNNPRIWVTFQLEGFHRYPDAPDQVAYLRNEHRHMFNFKVTLEVTHDNREVEFHMFRSELISLFGKNTLQIDHKSCEMLAADVMNYLDMAYSGRFAEVEVSEDGECGAVLTRPNVEDVRDVVNDMLAEHRRNSHDSFGA